MEEVDLESEPHHNLWHIYKDTNKYGFEIGNYLVNSNKRIHVYFVIMFR